MAPLSTARRAGVIERFIPRADLRPFVDLIWQYNGLMQAHDLERVLPTGTMSIIINLADDTSRKYAPADPRRVQRLPRSILSGPHGAYFLIDTAEQASILGVAFAPGGAASLPPHAGERGPRPACLSGGRLGRRSARPW